MFRRRRRRAEGPPPVVLDVEGDRSLAGGTVVDAAIVARLARIPLLRLEGTVVLTPGRVPPPAVGPTVRIVAGSVEPRTDGGIGAGLPGVARRLEELREG